MSEILSIYSWNVNGLRAVIRKHALQDFISATSPDILCLQETKINSPITDADFLSNYNIHYNFAKRKGYSGTAILVKKSLGLMPRRVEHTPDFLDEGRVVALEFDKFYLVDVYTPNSKPDLSRLDLRHTKWDPDFLKYLKSLELQKPIITCGDFNAAHQEIDIARPRANHHSAGFTDEERQGITNYLSAGFIDTFRQLHPDTVAYTWWSHWGHARENNVGWRIDYFFTSPKLTLSSAGIHPEFLGSDHCPISIEITI